MTQLVDQYGRPVKRTELKSLLAEPGLTSVRQAWLPSVASGLTPARLGGILNASAEGNLYDYLVLAEEMEERDPHYSSVLGVRKRTVSGVVPIVTPASEDNPKDVKIAEAVREHIAEHDGFADLVEDIMDALGKGFSVIEIDWECRAKDWRPRKFIHRSPTFFTFDRDTGQEIRLIDEGNMVDGIELQPHKFITHTAKLKSGIAIRGGLARLIAFGWICKAYTVKDWIAFIETYGLPIRLGKYGAGATDKDVEKLFQAVANIGTDAAAVLPESMRIEFQEVTRGAGNDIFENLARWVDEQTSKAVLGQTMTSDNGSSQAQAKVHNEVRHDIAVADARSVSGTLNRDLVRAFVDLNFGKQETYPKLSIIIEEPEDVDMVLQNADRMIAHGVRIKQSELRQKMGFSDPDADDEIAGVPKADPPKVDPPTKTALNRAQSDPHPFDALDGLEEDALTDWEEVMGDTLAPVREIIESSGSYEEALDRLKDALPEMGGAALIDGLVKSALKARGIGDQGDG